MRPMEQQHATDLLIIGAGPSGLALSLAYGGRSQILESADPKKMAESIFDEIRGALH